MADDPSEEEVAPSRRALFDFGDTRVLEALYPVLKKYLHNVDITLVLDELRQTLVSLPRDPEQNPERLRSLHGVLSGCTACGDLVQGPPELPNWNRVDPDMVLVTDQHLSDTSGIQLLVEGLKQAGFSSTRVGATSVVRCTPASEKVTKTQISNCVKRFLLTELGLMAPKLIIGCGSLASRTLLQREVMVSEEAGEITWIGPWPVMANVSPGWALSSEGRQQSFINTLKTAYTFVYGA